MWRWAKKATKFAFMGAAILVGLAWLGYWGLSVYLEDRLPPIQSVASYIDHVPKMSRVYDANGELIHTFWTERRSVVRLSDLPPHVLHAAVAAEDGAFYTHGGVDVLGMMRAIVVNIKAGEYRQGASTITQQLARSFYLSAEKTLMRKFKELFLARKLERHLTKDEILLLYLNQIYFGHGRYGVKEASRYYLGRDISQVSVGEAALLMAVLPAPERLNPFTNLKACLKRRGAILDRMLAGGWITPKAHQSALAERIATLPGNGAKRLRAPAFVDVVRRRLIMALGIEPLLKGGLAIHTTLNPAVQRAMNQAVAAAPFLTPDGPQVAMVFLRPRTGEILGMIGGRKFDGKGFNRAIQARRQAGSTFKTFVYGAGLASGELTPQTTFKDTAVTYRGASGRWTPRNHNRTHSGRAITVKRALATSSNVISVQVLRRVGVTKMVAFARQMGIRSPIPADLSAALGSASVTPIELANAYATIANGGYAGEVIAITRVEGPGGKVLFAERSARRRVLDVGTSTRLTSMLVEAVADGTGRSAAIDGLTVAGKTGTTNANHDAWFVGYVPELLGLVWIGYDQPKPMKGVSGPSKAAPLWRDAVQRLVVR